MEIPTIKDVARQAGVSIATVSRALNSNGYCSDAMREAVMQAVQALNYKPNTMARSLKTSSSYTVGLVVTDITNPFFAAIAKISEEVLGQHNYNLIICNTNESAEREMRHLTMLGERRVDGILLCSTGKNNAYIQYLVEIGIVVILIDRQYEELGLDVIKDDNEYGSYLLTQLLVERGHKRIALIKGNPSSNATLERERGYLRALKEAAIPSIPSYIAIGGMSGEDTAQVIEQLMQLEERPTAFFATNSLIAKYAIMVFNAMHLIIGKDIALASYGLEEFKTLYHPTITCMVQKPERVGYLAA